MRAKAANSKRRLAEIEPDQPEGGSRIEWQAGQDADTALAELPQACDWGSKRDAHGKPKYWKGVKLHAEVTREGIPVAVVCSSASLHDSQAFIPLMKKAAERIGPHVALADAAYDAEQIRTASAEEDNVPIIDANKRGGEAARAVLLHLVRLAERRLEKEYSLHFDPKSRPKRPQ